MPPTPAPGQHPTGDHGGYPGGASGQHPGGAPDGAPADLPGGALGGALGGVPGQAVPGQGIPGQAVPDQALPGQAMPGQAVGGQAMPGQPPVYGAPLYPGFPQPQMVIPWPQQPEPQPEPEPPVPGGQAVRAMLILAAVAGVVTVAVGLLFLLNNPEEYGLADDGRTSLNLGVQPSAAPDAANAGALTRLDPNAAAPVPSLPPAPAMQPSTPKRLIIPKLGVNAPIRSVGLDRRGAIQVPPVDNHNLVGWYRHGPTAGQAGPAVMLGHKDTRTRSAVFSRVHELRHGDTIEVTRMDGTVAVFTVGGIEQAGKEIFPTHRVYGDAATAELRLITCGGYYDRSTGHYTDNVIVYATMTGTRLSR